MSLISNNKDFQFLEGFFKPEASSPSQEIPSRIRPADLSIAAQGALAKRFVWEHVTKDEHSAVCFSLFELFREKDLQLDVLIQHAQRTNDIFLMKALFIRFDPKEILSKTMDTNDIELLRFVLEAGGNKWINEQNEHGFAPLHIATRKRCYSGIDLLVQKGADINVKDQKGDTPLHHATFIYDELMISHLLEKHNANKEVKNYEGFTPSLAKIAKGYKIDDLPVTEYDHQFLATKTVSHFFGLRGSLFYEEAKIELEGNCPLLMHPFFAEALVASPQLKDQDQIKEIFLDAANPLRRKSEIINKICAGEPVLVNGGWSGHHVQIYFFDGYMAIANGGERDDRKTFEVFAIDSTKMTLEMLLEIEVDPNRTLQEGLLLYTSIPAKLSKTDEAIQDHKCQEWMRLFAFPEQTVGNCSLAGLQGMFPFVLSQALEKKGISDVYHQAMSISQEFEQFSLQYILYAHEKDLLPGFWDVPGVRGLIGVKLIARNPLSWVKERFYRSIQKKA